MGSCELRSSAVSGNSGAVLCATWPERGRPARFHDPDQLVTGAGVVGVHRRLRLGQHGIVGLTLALNLAPAESRSSQASTAGTDPNQSHTK